MSARGNVSAEEWRAMARAAVAGQPGLLVADGDGPPRLAADVLAEAAAEQQQAELDARALLAAGDAMAGDSACDPSASPRWPRCWGRRRPPHRSATSKPASPDPRAPRPRPVRGRGQRCRGA